MNVLVALAVGYVLGTKTRGRQLDDLGRSLKVLCATDEFGDVVAAARAHAGTTLRDLAAMVDGHTPASDNGGDLVAQVRHLVGHEY